VGVFATIAFLNALMRALACGRQWKKKRLFEFEDCIDQGVIYPQKKSLVFSTSEKFHMYTTYVT